MKKRRCAVSRCPSLAVKRHRCRKHATVLIFPDVWQERSENEPPPEPREGLFWGPMMLQP
jgi:hypothetical protein